jgi:hypothetical protein
MQIVRVTSVLEWFAEPELVAWQVKLGRKEAGIISKRAMKIGTQVDELIKTAEEPAKKDSKEVKECMAGYKQFLKDWQVDAKALRIPERFTIEEEGITGQADLYHPELGLIDIKCSSEIRPKYWLQLAKYHQGMKLTETDKISVLRLGKETGLYEFASSENVGIAIPYALSIFDCLHSAYRYFNQGKLEESQDADTYSTDSAKD